MLAGAPAIAQTQDAPLPDTPAGKLIAPWIKLCQTPDFLQIQKWLRENLSYEAAIRETAKARANEQLQLCSANGGFRVVEVTKSEPKTISILVMGLKSDIWFDMTLVANDLGKLDRSGTRPTEPAESALPKDLSDAALAKEVESTVAKMSEAGYFSGIVTVARGTHTIVSASGGYADREKRTPITGSTKFTVGSLSKMFTAVAISQLIDQKKMLMDYTVGRYFPDYPNKTVRDNVTVGMLLSHTAGMGDFLDKRTPEMMKNGVKRAAEFMPLYDKDEPKFPPGSGWAYSNAGLALAGAIVEQVSGENYPDYIRKHIFAVAGMNDSDPNNNPSAATNLVTPYTKLTTRGTAPDWIEADRDLGSPAGGAISTTDDLVRFADALRSGKLVSKASFEELILKRATAPWGAKFGYGMEITDLYGRTLIGHGGGYPGVSTRLTMVLDSPYTVVTLSNQDPPSDSYAGSKAVALTVEKAKLEK